MGAKVTDRWAREAAAIAEQGMLIMRNARRPSSAVRGDRVAVFIHGFLAYGPVFDPMRRRVEEALGLATLDFSYSPLRAPEAIAEELEAHLAAHVPSAATVSLVGHSLGGIVARWYLQHGGGRARVDRLISLATPHAGTKRAPSLPLAQARALRPGSETLRALGDRAGDIPHLAIVAEADTLVSPVESAASVAGAQIARIPGVGHNALLFDDRAHRLVIEALGEEWSPIARAAVKNPEGGPPTNQR